MDQTHYAYGELRMLLEHVLQVWPVDPPPQVVIAARYWLRHHCVICARPLRADEMTAVPICGACWSGQLRRGLEQDKQDAGEVPF